MGSWHDGALHDVGEGHNDTSVTWVHGMAASSTMLSREGKIAREARGYGCASNVSGWVETRGTTATWRVQEAIDAKSDFSRPSVHINLMPSEMGRSYYSLGFLQK